VPLEYVAVHAAPQAMPAGVLVTVPGPDSLTAKETLGPFVEENAALTDWAKYIATVQLVCDPLQAPPQPSNVKPAPGCAVSVAKVPVAS
jgi:hypothetical protein